MDNTDLAVEIIVSKIRKRLERARDPVDFAREAFVLGRELSNLGGFLVFHTPLEKNEQSSVFKKLKEYDKTEESFTEMLIESDDEHVITYRRVKGFYDNDHWDIKVDRPNPQ